MAKRKPKPKVVKQEGWPHNGEGHPELQFPDPVNGQMIGGQVAFVRMAMRYKHVVCPWARRQGKSKARPFLYQNEATITPGEYYAGLCFPDHTTAAKIADNFRKSWGGMVKGYKINDKDQDRWIELHPLVPPPGMPPPDWFTPEMAARWIAAQDKGEVNEYCKIYFWGCAFPHFAKVQGFPHHFNRIGWDETQQIHPLAYDVIRPMRRDVDAPEEFTGTPYHIEIGNVQFKKWWNYAHPTKGLPGWFRMRIPDGSNPHSVPVSEDEQKTMSEQAIRQTLHAEFLTGEGAVFSNLDRVLVLPFIAPDDDSLAWVRKIRSNFAMPSMEWWVHQPTLTERHVYGTSVDWARSPKGDYTVCGVYDLTLGIQVAVFRWRGEDFSSQMEAALAIQEHYGATQLHSDDNGIGGSMIDFMRRRHSLGFRAHKFGRNKGDYVTRGRVLFQDADISLIDFHEQRNEFESYSAFEPEGVGETLIKYGAPQGEHDDIVSSFLMIAPTLTIIGRQDASRPEEVIPPMFDEEGLTTLEQFTEGAELPWSTEAEPEGFDWSSVVL